MTACAAGGTLLPPALGAISNAGVGGDVGGAGATSATVPTTPIWTVAAGRRRAGNNFYGEDVQLNVTSTIASGITTRAVIVYLVPG